MFVGQDCFLVSIKYFLDFLEEIVLRLPQNFLLGGQLCEKDVTLES